MRLGILRKHNEPARVPIESVDNATTWKIVLRSRHKAVSLLRADAWNRQ
jgi:hypothetical protein